MEKISSQGDDTQLIPNKIREEKQMKIEELKLKVKQLRDERIARHAARVDQLKKKNFEKYGSQTPIIPVSKKNGGGDINKSLNGPKHSISSGSFKFAQDKISMVSKATSTTTILNHGDPPAPAKPSMSTKKNKYSNVEKRVDCRMSFMPQSNRVPKSHLHPGKAGVPLKDGSDPIGSADLKPNSSTTQVSGKEHSLIKAFPSTDVPNNVSKKTDTSFGFVERLSKPKLISASSTALPTNKDKQNQVVPKSGRDSIQNKRWTMASIERLSRPKTVTHVTLQNKPTSHVALQYKPISHVALQHKPISHFPVNKNADKPSRVSENPKRISRRVTEVHKPQVESIKDFKETAQLRRSLSTVHFKRLGPGAAKKCLKRTLSAGNLKRKDIEDEVSHDFPHKDYILPVESERKKSVKFMTPHRKTATPPMFLNTPKPSELRQRLNDWLQKRGKSLSYYHHLHCFGIHGQSTKTVTEPVHEVIDDENKENEEITDDDDSLNENMTGHVKDLAAEWRRASHQMADSPAVCVKSPQSTPVLKKLTPEKPSDSLEPTVTGALHDLHSLILEDYSWQQCAEWLRVIARSCGTAVTEAAPYWECRAALEEKRGDFPRAVECYNKAIMQGAQPADVEASLDQLLQKFMKLNLDPENNKASTIIDPKFVDVKNVFKSTLIRFAIQQKNFFESKDNSDNQKKYVATPVRRSSRLSKVTEVLSTTKTEKTNGHHNVNGSGTKRLGLNLPTPKAPLAERVKTPAKTPLKPATPLNKSAKKSVTRQTLVQLCSTLRNVDDEIRNSMVFVPNKALNFNDC